MSELKAILATPHPKMKNACDGAIEVYPKDEADKVIAELKSEIERLEILCANYRHDCDNLAISNEQVKRAARTLLKKMNHNKYKRCSAMARWCKRNRVHASACGPIDKIDFWEKWLKRWLELAEKFKEAK